MKIPFALNSIKVFNLFVPELYHCNGDLLIQRPERSYSVTIILHFFL